VIDAPPAGQALLVFQRTPSYSYENDLTITAPRIEQTL
jgi:hypothetical protein